MLVRDATDADRGALVVLWRELMDVHATHDPRFALAADADHRFLDYVDTARTREDYRVRVATAPTRRGRARGEVLGFTIACVLPNAPMYRTRWIGYINDICVTASARGRGIGRALVRDALDWMKNRGAESFEVYVARSNAAASRFWRAVGGTDYLERLSLDPRALDGLDPAAGSDRARGSGGRR